MRFDYNQQTVSQGRANQAKAIETPNTFATNSGVDKVDQPKQRMAGQVGDRLMAYLNDPNEQKRTENWMARFGLSNQGAMFNQAKMGGDRMETMLTCGRNCPKFQRFAKGETPTSWFAQIDALLGARCGTIWRFQTN